VHIKVQMENSEDISLLFKFFCYYLHHVQKKMEAALKHTNQVKADGCPLFTPMIVARQLIIIFSSNFCIPAQQVARSCLLTYLDKCIYVSDAKISYHLIAG
jgi:hypothetical protein